MSSVATVIAGPDTKLTSATLKALAETLQSNEIVWQDEGRVADIFCSLPAAVIYDLIKTGDQPFDVIAQPVENRRKKFLIADMESTIIEQEMLDELAEVIGQRDKVAAITRRAMNGELDFAAALRERAALLKGRPVDILGDVAKRITYMPGAANLVIAMKNAGATCWLVSGGFNCFVEPVAKQLGFDKFYANELIVEGGFITGEVAEPILDKNSKKALLEQGCHELGVPLSMALAVGDGANDVPMLEACNAAGGLGVAFQAKPRVREAVPHQINYGDLNALIYASGY